MASPSSLPSKRSLARPRPSLVANTQQPASPTPPPIASPLLSPESMLARKASFQQLTQNSLAAVPDGSAEYALSASQQARGRPDYGLAAPGSRKSTEIEIGDIVDTPGGMHGRVRFIGSVKGKAGVFCGVELVGDLIGKGKNDGTVEGCSPCTSPLVISTNRRIFGLAYVTFLRVHPYQEYSCHCHGQRNETQVRHPT